MESSMGKMKNYFSKCVKVTVTILLSAAFFYFGMKDYVNVGKNNIAVAQLYGTYPTVSQAKGFLEDYENGDEITDVCFVWNGGVQEIRNPRYFRQTNVTVTGVVGMASLYDRQAASLEENDEKGCVIDKNTALELFGSEACVGNQVAVGEMVYEVRGVASWNQQMLLIRPSQKSLICTQVLIRSKKGQSMEMTASNFLMGTGLSGTVVDDSWLDGILPWFPVTFLFMFTIAASKWGHMVIIFAPKCECSFNRKKENVGFWENVLERIKLRKYGCFILEILLWTICLFFSIKLLSGIPVSWLPDKWSDFSFWTEKIRKTEEAFRWYLMFPKSMSQVERLVSQIGCMAKCGAAALLATLAAVLFY